MKKSMKLLLVFWLGVVFLSACAKVQTREETTEASNVTKEAEVSESKTVMETQQETTADLTDYTLSLETDSLLLKIPSYKDDLTETNWRTEQMGDGAELLSITEVENGEGYEQYLSSLALSGFSCYTENEIGDNHYATWVSEEIRVTTVYNPGNQNVRIIAEPSSLGVLPGLEKDNVYMDAGITPVIAQVGTDHDGDTDNGMCYIYRLCDGSFLIVDSGTNNEATARAILETLQKLAENPDKIVIAAWVISHAHGDHTGGFFALASQYGDRVTLEKVIYNLPTEAVFEQSDTALSQLTKMANALSIYEPTEMIEAHPGQKIYLRNAVIEMLYTWDLYPEPNHELDFFNNTSLVFSVKLGGQQIMQLGDCGPETAKVLEAIYGEKILRSDIIQVAHHGYKGASVALNKMICAPIVLWPTTQEKIGRFKYQDYNACVIEGAEYIYVADQTVTVLPLPFNEAEVQTWIIEHYVPDPR